MSVKGGSNEENAVIHIFEDDGGIAQKWKLRRLNDGSYQIIAACAGDAKCLTNYGGSTENSHPLTSVGTNGTHPDQSWYL